MARTSALFVSILLACPAAARAQAITGIGFLPGFPVESEAFALSADGSTLAGRSNPNRAIRWTAAAGIQDLGLVVGGSGLSVGSAISGDGQTVVGNGQLGGDAMAFRWSSAGGMLNLGFLPGGNSSLANGVSGDGSVVVGTATIPATSRINRAFRWTIAGGMQDLGVPGPNTEAKGNGVSADGSVVVGYIVNANNVGQAFRWTATAGMTFITPLAAGHQTIASAISADGSVIIGTGFDGNDQGYALRWVGGGAPQDLGVVTGFPGPVPRAANADGSVIVGDVPNGTQIPWLWTPSLGMVNLTTYLAAQGIDLTGWSLRSATGISADGRTICGWGFNSGNIQGFIVTLPPCLTLSGPANAVACATGSAMFSVAPSGAGPFTFHWRRAGVPMNIAATPSAATSTLLLPIASAAGPGPYDCIVSNACGSVISNPAILRINSADFNGDGDTGTDADIEAFFACLAGFCCPTCGSADFNADGDTGTDADIESFFRVLAGGAC